MNTHLLSDEPIDDRAALHRCSTTVSGLSVDRLGSVGRPSWRGRLHFIALISGVPVLAVRAARHVLARLMRS